MKNRKPKLGTQIYVYYCIAVILISLILSVCLVVINQHKTMKECQNEGLIEQKNSFLISEEEIRTCENILNRYREEKIYKKYHERKSKEDLTK